jgi:hypothetical protein
MNRYVASYVGLQVLLMTVRNTPLYGDAAD